MSLRIGFDARWYNDSGVGTYVAGLLRALAEHIRDVDLVVYENPGNEVPSLEGLHIHRVPVRSRRYSLRAQLEFAIRCRRDRLDLFHSPFYAIPVSPGCPVIVTIHDLIPFLFRIDSQPKRTVVKMGYNVAVHRSARVIAVSHSTARDIESILGIAADRISVVHNAVSHEYFYPGGTSQELDHLSSKYGIQFPYVVTPSPRNRRTKNCTTSEAVLRQVRTTAKTRFQSVAYGPGEDLSRTQTPDALHVGFIPTADLGSLFRHAHAFLMTPLYEGFGLPLLEAMSCGCPVVSSNGGALPEVAGNGAQLFAPSDVEGMSLALAALFDDVSQRSTWRERAIARAGEFSWAKAAEETARVYREVCGLLPSQNLALEYTQDAHRSRY